MKSRPVYKRPAAWKGSAFLKVMNNNMHIIQEKLDDSICCDIVTFALIPNQSLKLNKAL